MTRGREMLNYWKVQLYIFILIILIGLIEFKKDIEIHMGSCVMKVQTSLYNTYDSTSKEFDGKLQELADVINRIGKFVCSVKIINSIC